MTLNLRPLAQEDFELLHGWLNKPHMHPFYVTEPVSLASVGEEFALRVGGGHAINSVIASEDRRPFGYLQWYLNAAYPDYGAATLGKTDGVSIDYFIGEESFLGRGLGPSMLNSLVETTLPALEPIHRQYFICHDDNNRRAIQCTRRAGFVADRQFIAGGISSTLFIRDETH
jgi:aminoglycoside 6'-N-acetyltransferase